MDAPRTLDLATKLSTNPDYAFRYQEMYFHARKLERELEFLNDRNNRAVSVMLNFMITEGLFSSDDIEAAIQKLKK